MKNARRPSRILYITAASPVPSKIGPARRHYHILDQLSRFYEVRLLSLGNLTEKQMFGRTFADRVPHFDFVPKGGARTSIYLRKSWRTLTARCDFYQVLEPRLRQRCSQILSADSFDAIYLSTVLLRGLPLPADVPVIADTHNVEFDVLRRMATSADSFLRRIYCRRQWVATRREERSGAHNVDLLLATSERDREVFETELGVRGVEVIPNGIDLHEFTPADSGGGESGTILFTGLMNYYPNQQAVRWFVNSVFPAIVRQLPSAKFIVAGAAPPAWLRALRDTRVEVTGAVPDMRPFIERAAVVIAPLLIGGGTRVKILEAQAMGKPVVSTTLGAEGLGERHGESILIADDPASFGRQVVRVLNDADLARRIGKGGRNHVVRHFDWNLIGERLGRLLRARIGLIPNGSLNDNAR